MSVPARKKSRSAVRRRRSHHGIKAVNVGVCQACSAPVLSHRACTQCGMYKGQQAVDVSRDAARAVRKAQAAAHAHTHDHAPAPEAADAVSAEETTESKETEEKAS